MLIRKIKRFISEPCLLPFRLDEWRIITLPDDKYLKYRFKVQLGRELDLENPKTYDEKLQWLKIYDRNPKYIQMVDKYEVKKYISDTIGKEYVIPTIGIYDSYDDINFDELPNQFVMKCTHDSGSVVLCKDKKKFDIEENRKKINKALSVNYYYSGREWPYKDVKPRILIEKYMEDKKDKELRDYKFYCFDGYVKALLLATNRLNKNAELNFDYFDSDFNHLNLTNHFHPNNKKVPHKPKKFDEMVKLASKLSKGIPHVRVDFYEANGHIYFGELTLFDQSGFLQIHPDDWEMEWGDLIKLPNKK